MTSLTIAIPTYNRGPRLAVSLTSLLKQISSADRRRHIDVLVCDNGSTDNTSEVLQAAAAEYQRADVPFSIFARAQNAGFAENFASCLDNSRSDYVWTLSDDDNVLPGAVDVVVDALLDFRPGVAVFAFNQGERQTPVSAQPARTHADKECAITALTDYCSFAKLSRLVVSRTVSLWPDAMSEIRRSSLFPHLIAALEIGHRTGDVLLVDFPLAAPDADYMEHIDFMPYVALHHAREVHSWSERRAIDVSAILDAMAPATMPDVLATSLSFLMQKERRSRWFPADLEALLRQNVRNAVRGQKSNAEGFSLHWSFKSIALLGLLALATAGNWCRTRLGARTKPVMSSE